MNTKGHVKGEREASDRVNKVGRRLKEEPC